MIRNRIEEPAEVHPDPDAEDASQLEGAAAEHWADGVRPSLASVEMATKWWTLLVVCLSVFMLLLDITIVNVALPDIQKDLGSTFEDLQWVVDAYALALAALLLASGSLADLLGRRRIFVIGLVLFAAASLLCGLSGSPTMLNLARGFQGLGGAMMFATSLALIAQEFAPARARHGLRHLGRHHRLRRRRRPARRRRAHRRARLGMDLPRERADRAAHGRADAHARARIRPRPDGPHRLARARDLQRRPLLPHLRADPRQRRGLGERPDHRPPDRRGRAAGGLRRRRAALPSSRCSTSRLFRVPTFTGAQIVAFSIHASMFSMFLYIVLYMQNVLGYSPLETGVRFLPISLLSFIAAPIAGKLSERYPVRIFLGSGPRPRRDRRSC